MKNSILFEEIRKKIENSRFYSIENKYRYFVYPYKGLEPIKPAEMNYLGGIIAKKISNDVDLLFTFETDGIFVTYSVASLLNKPLVVARAFHYNLKNPMRLTQETGYYTRELFFSLGDKDVKKVAIIDCIHSTGGSVKSAIKLFSKLGIEVEGVYVVINKPDYNDKKFLEKIKDKFFAIYDVKIIGSHLKVDQSKYLGGF